LILILAGAAFTNGQGHGTTAYRLLDFVPIAASTMDTAIDLHGHT